MKKKLLSLLFILSFVVCLSSISLASPVLQKPIINTDIYPMTDTVQIKATAGNKIYMKVNGAPDEILLGTVRSNGLLNAKISSYAPGTKLGFTAGAGADRSNAAYVAVKSIARPTVKDPLYDNQAYIIVSAQKGTRVVLKTDGKAFNSGNVPNSGTIKMNVGKKAPGTVISIFATFGKYESAVYAIRVLPFKPTVSAKINDSSKIIKGKASANAEVNIYQNGSRITKVKADSSGNYTIRLKKPLKTDSTITIKSYINKLWSNAYAAKASLYYKYQTPKIDQSTNVAKYITGTGTAGAKARLSINGKVDSTKSVASNGKYSFSKPNLKPGTKVTVQLFSSDMFYKSRPASMTVADKSKLMKGKLLVLNVKTNYMNYYSDGILVKQFRIASGKSSTPTPEGKFKIKEKIVNRPYHKKGIKGGAPNNPLGPRWLGLNTKGAYAIHGNADSSSIGKRVSNGCVRMYNNEVIWLYDRIPIGTSVVIKKTSSSHKTIAKNAGFNVLT